jgi:hypothetical protein
MKGLTLFSEANKKLQDTNDSMRSLVDMPTFRQIISPPYFPSRIYAAVKKIYL